jgi:hypothetical protein
MIKMGMATNNNFFFIEQPKRPLDADKIIKPQSAGGATRHPWAERVIIPALDK